MDLYKLSKICDSAISDSRESDYREAAKVLNNNFYAILLSKVETFVRRSDKAKDTPKQTTTSILGNQVIIEYDPNRGKIKLNVNGVDTYEGKYGKNNSIDSVVSTVESEVSNKVDISRPNGSNIWKERQQLSEKNLDDLGVTFPKSVYKAMEGKGSTSIVKNNRKSKKVLKKDEYDYLIKNDQINADDFIKRGDFYLKKGSPVFYVKGEYNDIVQNIDEVYAREKGFKEFSDENILNRAYVVYKDDIFVLDNESIRRFK